MTLASFLSLFKEGRFSAKSHMKNLLEMAMADGHFDNSEREFLDKIATKYGMTTKKLNQIKDDPGEIKFEVPESDKIKFEQLYDLVHMMLIDEYTDQQELQLCGLFARKFGYAEHKIDELIQAIIGNIENKQSAEDTRKRIEWLLT